MDRNSTRLDTETIKNWETWEPEIKVEHRHENNIDYEVIKNFDPEKAWENHGTTVTRVSHEVIPEFDPEKAWENHGTTATRVSHEVIP